MISEYNELRKDKIIRVEENKKKFIINEPLADYKK